MNSNDLSSLPAEALTARLAALANEERALLVEFLRHLDAFDERKLYAGHGHSSLFVYCTEGLKLSNGSAYRRIVAARLLRKFPVIADLLGDGRITLSKLKLLRKVLTPQNHLELLQRATLETEEQVALLAATLNPRPDVRDSMRRLPARTSSPSFPSKDSASAHDSAANDARTFSLKVEASDTPPSPSAGSDATSPRTFSPKVDSPDAPRAESSNVAVTFSLKVDEGHVAAPGRIVPVEPRMEVQPTSADSYSVKLRVGREFIDEFNAVKAALSHKIPDGNFEAVLRECFRITLEVVEKRRIGGARKPSGVAPASKRTAAPIRPQQEDPRPVVVAAAVETVRAAPSGSTRKQSRYIPAPVRQAVWKRDGGVCAFVSADGKRCGSNHMIDFHHEVPFARGGRSTVDNLSLRCRLHNHYEAVLDFGAEFMRSKVTRAVSPDEKSLSPRKCGSPAPLAPDPATSH